MPREMTQLRQEEILTDEKKRTPQIEVLVGKAARNDKAALYELCEIIARDILFRATCILGNRTDAEDVAQEVLIRVCTKIRSLRDPKVFSAWLNKIIANEAKRYMAENARRGIVLDIDDYLESITEEKDDFLPQECAENSEYRKAVMEVISKLPMRQREAIIFYYYDGLSVTETAEAMGMTKPSVSKYLALAREKIKREINSRECETGKLGMLAIGPVLSGILRYEPVGLMPPGDVWMQQALAQCKAHIQAIPVPSPAKALALKSPFGPLMGAFGAVFTVAALITGITLNGVPRANAGAQEISIEGTVVFSGGVENGGNTAYVNPEYAEPSADSTGGETRILQWWITEAGSDTVLHESGESEIGDVLIKMQKDGADGKYMIYFRLEDEVGAIHRLGRSFYIITNTQ